MKRSRLDDARNAGLPIRGVCGGAVLVPVGGWVLDDVHLIDQMVAWRQAARDSFFAQFPPSRGSMERYIRTVSIGQPATILFMVEGSPGTNLGHVGLKCIESRECEVDSVMSNPDIQRTGVMRAALTEMLDWAHEELGISTFTLKVRSDNVPAMRLYERLGFESNEVLPLKRVRHGSETNHVPCDADVSDVDFRMVIMRRADSSHAGSASDVPIMET